MHKNELLVWIAIILLLRCVTITYEDFSNLTHGVVMTIVNFAIPVMMFIRVMLIKNGR